MEETATYDTKNSLLDLEAKNPLDCRATVMFTRAQHLALSRLAQAHHTNFSNLMRDLAQIGATQHYPEYSQIYEQALREVTQIVT